MKNEEEARREKEKGMERKRREEERAKNVFACEIKWCIYSARSQYTYVRPTVNYTVNRGVLFDRRGNEDRARARARATKTKDEDRAVRGEKVEREDTTTAKFMERGMIYGTIVENKSHGSKDV